VSAAVKVRPARYCDGAILDGQYARASWRDWIADTSTGCGCEIGGFTGCEPTRVYADLGHALDFAISHAATHTCPPWRASGERCTTFCADCGGRGWVA
jgi:hypothetical protein